MTRVLIVPGLNGSGPEHWQSKWERLDARCQRVELPALGQPELSAWRDALVQAIAREPGPVVLVAHSLGCMLVAHWAREAAPGRVLGALLVAPADVEGPLPQDTPECVRGFAPVPLARLPFASIVVGSHDDPYASLERTRQWAEAWGARLVDAGHKGHLNADSQLGTWPLGRALLDELLREAPFALDSRLSADTLTIGESGLSLLLLMNERRYPWLILVPKLSGLSEVVDLDEDDASRLWDESCAVARALRQHFAPDKINIAALGNVVRQLHVHHVARYLDDPAWPGPVFGHSPRQPYSPEACRGVVETLARSHLREWFRFV